MRQLVRHQTSALAKRKKRSLEFNPISVPKIKLGIWVLSIVQGKTDNARAGNVASSNKLRCGLILMMNIAINKGSKGAKPNHNPLMFTGQTPKR